MNWLWRNLPTVQGRIITGVALISAIVLGLWPDHARPFDPAKALPIAGAALAWLFAELAGAGRPRDHDIAFYRQISEVMNDDALTFLQQHDFNIDLQQGLTHPVDTIAQWHGARYEFLDAGLQRRWLAVRGQINDLAEQYGAKLVSSPVGQGMLTARLLGFERHNQPEHALAEIRELNATASALYDSYNDFDRYARRKLSL